MATPRLLGTWSHVRVTAARSTRFRAVLSTTPTPSPLDCCSCVDTKLLPGLRLRSYGLAATTMRINPLSMVSSLIPINGKGAVGKLKASCNVANRESFPPAKTQSPASTVIPVACAPIVAVDGAPSCVGWIGDGTRLLLPHRWAGTKYRHSPSV